VDAGDAELHGYVDGLHRWLDACDIGVVQGGLTTTMELVAARRPFLYFPLERHFEQQLHVANRLARHGAGRRMEYSTATPGRIAQAIAEELGRTVAYRAVPPGGAARAAALIAPLLGR
jgi:UDP-N-acetylglucosamine:LPS N-acetylglucosamine transferase